MRTTLRRAQHLLYFLAAAVRAANGRHHMRPGTHLRLVLRPGPDLTRTQFTAITYRPRWTA